MFSHVPALAHLGRDRRHRQGRNDSKSWAELHMHFDKLYLSSGAWTEGQWSHGHGEETRRASHRKKLSRLPEVRDQVGTPDAKSHASANALRKLKGFDHSAGNS